MAFDAFEIPAGESSGRPPQIEARRLARTAFADFLDLRRVRRPESEVRRQWLDLTGPMRHYDVELLPVVCTAFGTVGHTCRNLAASAESLSTRSHWRWSPHRVHANASGK